MYACICMFEHHVHMKCVCVDVCMKARLPQMSFIPHAAYHLLLRWDLSWPAASKLAMVNGYKLWVSVCLPFLRAGIRKMCCWAQIEDVHSGTWNLDPCDVKTSTLFMSSPQALGFILSHVQSLSAWSMRLRKGNRVMQTWNSPPGSRLNSSVNCRRQHL